MVGHGGVHADMVLEKELKVLYFDPQAAGSELKHTSNNATCPNSATLYELMGGQLHLNYHTRQVGFSLIQDLM